MPCTPGCGACCDPVYLSQDQAERVFAPDPGPQGAALQGIWAPLRGSDDGSGVLFACLNYDVGTRRCLAYEDRPPVCRGYPFYGDDRDLDRLVCGFQAERGRTVLPLVEAR